MIFIVLLFLGVSLIRGGLLAGANKEYAHRFKVYEEAAFEIQREREIMRHQAANVKDEKEYCEHIGFMNGMNRAVEILQLAEEERGTLWTDGN